MGSAGSGTFGNYKPKKNDDQCLDDLLNVYLEDIARLPYYQEYNKTPPIMEEIYILDTLYHGRIAVKSKESELIIGFLPTRFNYLISCLAKGIKYTGYIDFSIDQVIPRVSVNLYADR